MTATSWCRLLLPAAAAFAVAAGTVSTAYAASNEELAARFPRVRVVDEKDRHLPGVAVEFRSADQPFGVAAVEGKADYRLNHMDLGPWMPTAPGAAWDIIATDPKRGFASARIALAENPDPVTVKLKPGRQVSFAFETEDHREIPSDLTVLVATEVQLTPAWQSLDPQSNQKGVLNAFPEEPGRYVTFLDEATSGVYLIVHKPGFLTGFQTGPFGADDLAKGVLNVKLPATGKLEARLTVTGDQPTSPGYLEVARTHMYGPNSGVHVVLHSQQFDAPPYEATLEGFVPGMYEVAMGIGSRADRHQHGASKEGTVHEVQRVQIEAGAGATVALDATPFSMKVFDGPYTARVSLKNFSGESVAGQPYKLSTYDQRFGYVEVRAGTIPDNGVLVLEGLAAGISEPVTQSPAGPRPFRYSLAVGSDNEIPNPIMFVKLEGGTATPLPPGEIVEIDATLPPGVGDLAPDITLTSVTSDEQIKLSDLKGQVVFLDFWATWCGPCQDPMEKLNDLAKAKADDWKGKVALIGASIDDEKSTVLDHTKSKEWTTVQQYWCASDEGKGGWAAPQPKTYGVSGVPTALLIDQEGKIVWRGHPYGFDKEAEISKLLK